MSDYSVYETVQEIKQFVYSKTDVPSVATANECLETYRALIDQFSEDLENVAKWIESGLDRPADHPADSTEGESVETGTPVVESTVPDSEPAPVVDTPNNPDLNPPIDITTPPVTEIDPAQPPVTEIPVVDPNAPVAVNKPVTDQDVATALETNPPVDAPVVTDNPDTPPESTPVADNDGQSVDDSDPGAALAPTVVEPQEQGDTEPGPVIADPVPDGEPAPAPVADGTVVVPDITGDVSVSDLVDAANTDDPVLPTDVPEGLAGEVPTDGGLGTPADLGSFPDNR